MMLTYLLFACGQPAHLQYDFGRAYTEATAVQATLDRASAVDGAYAIGGAEALKIREASRAAVVDKEKGNPTVTASVGQ